MVFSLNVDYIRSNRGMIVTAEAVSIFILLLSGFQIKPFMKYNGELQSWLITFISGISSDWWDYISCGWRSLPSILFLGNILSIREFGASQCSKRVPSTPYKVFFPGQSGNYPSTYCYYILINHHIWSPLIIALTYFSCHDCRSLDMLQSLFFCT